MNIYTQEITKNTLLYHVSECVRDPYINGMYVSQYRSFDLIYSRKFNSGFYITKFYYR
jgi:hypothetical protein